VKHPTRSLTPQLVEQINADCKAQRWFWVAGLARAVWPALLPVKKAKVAVMAGDHYAEEGM